MVNTSTQMAARNRRKSHLYNLHLVHLGMTIQSIGRHVVMKRYKCASLVGFQSMPRFPRKTWFHHIPKHPRN
jgi:hypothetical protein